MAEKTNKADTVGASNNEQNEQQLATAPAQVQIESQVKFEAWNEPVKKAMKFYHAVGGYGLTKLDTRRYCVPAAGLRIACAHEQVAPILRDFPGKTQILKECCFCAPVNTLTGYSFCSGDHNFCVFKRPIHSDEPEFRAIKDANGEPIPEWGNLKSWIISGNHFWPCPCLVILQFTMCGDYGCCDTIPAGTKIDPRTTHDIISH